MIPENYQAIRKSRADVYIPKIKGFKPPLVKVFGISIFKWAYWVVTVEPRIEGLSGTVVFDEFHQ